MKKLVTILTLSAFLVGCSSNAEILAKRGENASLITDAELAQARKQRANEVEETQATTSKVNSVSGSVIGGAVAVMSAAGAVHSVMSIFK